MKDRGAADASTTSRGDLDHEEAAFLPTHQHTNHKRDGPKLFSKYYRRAKKLFRGHSRLTLAFLLTSAALSVYWMICDEGAGKRESAVGRISESQGGNGSTVRMEDGPEFVYRNKFGGHWDSTEGSQSAVCQSDIPPLSVPWDYSSMTISGVNLGGWLVLEPFITPHLFEPHISGPDPAVDEWHLSIRLGGQLAEVLEEHYATFITEKDFAEIAGAGLNWVRIPLPFWAVEKADDEPFLAHVSWKYFPKAIIWARKYGLRIKLDLHAVPGSQNGYNHSGKQGSVEFLNGMMGMVNAERTLNIIKSLIEFIMLDNVRDIVLIFGVLNEPLQRTIGCAPLAAFYTEVYRTIRNVTGVGKGPMISIHDGFQSTEKWFGFLEGADRIAMDSHSYLCFKKPNNASIAIQALRPCADWGYTYNNTMLQFGLTLAGEWSLAVNDCGRFLNNVGVGTRYEGNFPTPENPQFKGVGSCEGWEDYTKWSVEMKSDLRDVALAHMDATRNWFFWTWKTGPTLTTNLLANPLWSYSLGLSQGYIPENPRTSLGFCLANAAKHNAPTPTQLPLDRGLKSWQTGGVEAGVFVGGTKRWEWPPIKLSGGLVVSDLPRLTQTGRKIVLSLAPVPQTKESLRESLLGG